jgi:hypothetical protein
MRYALVNVLYRVRFPTGFITATDFRPTFDGHLLNVCTYIPAGLNASDTEAILVNRLRSSSRWMRMLRGLVRPGDKVQFCLGTKRPLRQYMKAWASRDDLSAGVAPRDVAEYWR